jgi:hypothetical protein
VSARGVTAATPLPSLAKMRAEPWQVRQMTKHDKLVSTCQYCKTLYRNAGAADLCEHWHHPIP